MGLFDSLENAIAGAPSLAQSAGAERAGAFAAVLRLVQSYPGGLGGLIQQFERAGLGSLAQSWLSAGENHALSPGQLEQALGAGPIDQVARDLQSDHGQAATHIASLLPLVIDHLSPAGHAQSAGVASVLEGLLNHFGS